MSRSAGSAAPGERLARKAGSVLVTLGAALALTGCAHRAVIVDDGLSARERAARLQTIEAWELSGQLIVDTGERRERMRVGWEQAGEALTLTVRGIALGAGSFMISGDAETLVIEGRGEARVLTDPETDLSREVGWWLPVTSLRYWLLGLPDPDFPGQENQAPGGVLETQSQRQWQIRYEEYQLAGLPVDGTGGAAANGSGAAADGSGAAADGSGAAAAASLLVPRVIIMSHESLMLTLRIDAWRPVQGQP